MMLACVGCLYCLIWVLLLTRSIIVFYLTDWGNGWAYRVLYLLSDGKFCVHLQPNVFTCYGQVCGTSRVNSGTNGLSQNFLQLNSTKTEFFVAGFSNTNIQILPLIWKLYACYKKKLGVLFACNLSFEQHITKLVQTWFYQLRSIARIWAMLSFKDTEMISHAFIPPGLDYCNSLNRKTIDRPQTVQNSAARLWTRINKF